MDPIFRHKGDFLPPSVIKKTQKAGDLLQYALPISVGFYLLGLWYLQQKEHFLYQALGIGGAAGLQKVVLLSLKNYLPRLRPDGSDFGSFPSGHSAGAALSIVPAIRSLGIDHFITVAYIGLTLLTAYSRIASKKHHPSDVAFGLLLGMSFGALAMTFGTKP